MKAKELEKIMLSKATEKVGKIIKASEEKARKYNFEQFIKSL
jgi:hypothetical protein